MEKKKLPVIMIHKDFDYLNWICNENEEGKIESIIINKKTNYIKKDLIELETVDVLKKSFEDLGWTKAYIPDINVIVDGVKQEFKLN